MHTNHSPDAGIITAQAFRIIAGFDIGCCTARPAFNFSSDFDGNQTILFEFCKAMNMPLWNAATRVIGWAFMKFFRRTVRIMNCIVTMSITIGEDDDILVFCTVDRECFNRFPPRNKFLREPLIKESTCA